MANKWVNLTDSDIDDILVTEVSEKLKNKLQRARKKISVASAKSKGRELQKWVCGRIADFLDIPYDQQDDQCLIHSREMGQSGVDVILRGGALKRFPFSVECKSTESLNIKEAIDQVKANQVPDTHWIVFHRRKSIPETMAILSADAFFDLLQGVKDDRNK